jgi:hypothetical protein
MSVGLTVQMRRSRYAWKIKINFWRWRLRQQEMKMRLRWRLWWGLAESGVRWSILCWCVWQESGLSHIEDVFAFNLIHKEIYKRSIFIPICRANATINCITVQRKNRFIPVNFDGSYNAGIKHSSRSVGNVHQSSYFLQPSWFDPPK